MTLEATTLMTNPKNDFLAMSRLAVELLRDPAVSAEWDTPSALAKFSVGGLAGHLAYQILALPGILTAPPASEPTVPLVEHYRRIPWVGADLDAEINLRIRTGGDSVAADGPASLIKDVETAIDELTTTLPPAADHAVRIPFWGPWSLTLNDLLITRMMEIAVHSDDLAVSVGVNTPDFPESAFTLVLDLLSQLSVIRHGQVNVLRALSRAERAPADITAF